MSGTRPDAFIPIFLADYLADTLHLSRDEHGAYFLLLMAYWRNGGPLPSDDQRLRTIVKATPHEWKRLKPAMLEFFKEENGLWHNKRSDMEIANATARMKAKSAAGKAGAKSRWQPHASAMPPAIADAITDTMTESMTKNGSSPSPTPKKEKKEIKSAFADIDPDFLQFWKAYPTTPNMSRKDALKNWEALKRSGRLPAIDQILQAVTAYKAFLAAESRKGGKPHPVKHAQGWLSGQRWETLLENNPLTAQFKPDWADSDPSWAAFKKSVPAAVWTNFFADCEWGDGVLRAPSKFVRDQIESRFRSQLTAVFPNFEVELKRA